MTHYSRILLLTWLRLRKSFAARWIWQQYVRDNHGQCGVTAANSPVAGHPEVKSTVQAFPPTLHTGMFCSENSNRLTRRVEPRMNGIPQPFTSIRRRYSDRIATKAESHSPAIRSQSMRFRLPGGIANGGNRLATSARMRRSDPFGFLSILVRNAPVSSSRNWSTRSDRRPPSNLVAIDALDPCDCSRAPDPRRHGKMPRGIVHYHMPPTVYPLIRVMARTGMGWWRPAERTISQQTA